ncbi:SMP-30/gluconolactonase/LRE family protein [Roseateles flavus]|uniref:SMP-30/gluconolactonase/LRE family protein n=1 Tax=Roseateles flavus TaxID=3149041 RepID=A0ABV0GKZ0_9BURK
MHDLSPPESSPVAFEVLTPEFEDLIRHSARLERLASHCRWAEGPAYFPALRSLVWSDIPNDRMLRWDEGSGRVSVLRAPCGHANGNTVDRQGRLISCEHSGRRVVRTEHDGRLTVLASHFEGRRLNSPNDVVVHSDGSVWFSDPPYGIESDYEGIRAPQEQAGCHVYRWDPVDGSVQAVIRDMRCPNGLAFSPDERWLYVADTGQEEGCMRRHAVGPDGQLGPGEPFLRCDTGFFDGFRCDEAGRLWTSAGRAVHCYRADGTLIGRIPMPERVSNLVFGGLRRNRLFICASSSVYSLLLATNGCPTF